MITANCKQLPTSYNWPRQHYPSTKCWKLWKKVIRDILVLPTSKEYELKQPLGHWFKSPTIYYYSVVDPITNILYIQNDISTPNIYLRYIPFTSNTTKLILILPSHPTSQSQLISQNTQDGISKITRSNIHCLCLRASMQLFMNIYKIWMKWYTNF